MLKQFFHLLLAFLGLAMMVYAQDSPAQTEGTESKKESLYQWTDDKGTVHITDGLNKVPEQYRDQATVSTEQQKEDGDQGRQVQQRQSPAPAADPDAGAKSAWQQRMRDAQQRLSNAESRYQQLDQRRNELLRSWGGPASGRIAERTEADEIGRQMTEVQKEIDDARRDLEFGIPEEARKAGVPPGWLRE